MLAAGRGRVSTSNFSLRGSKLSMALLLHSAAQTMSLSSTYTAYTCGSAPGAFQLRQLLAPMPSAGSCMERLPLFHSDTQRRPRLSDQTRGWLGGLP